VCVAFIPMHLGVCLLQKVPNMRLGADQIISRNFHLLLEFILFSLELFLFNRRLQNPFRELEILYLDGLCSNLSPRIFPRILRIF
jgi:hypothetical protein